jgi:hypothetical protein
VRVEEYEHEPVRGLPEYLPAGERLVWQGEPDWRVMARRVFHLRAISMYFALLVFWHLGSGLYTGQGLTASLLAGSWQIGLGLMAIGILTLLAWAYARATVYTLTDRRLVIRFGVALPMMVNIPLDSLEAADLRRFADGSGDVLLTVRRRENLSYMMLWPNVRSWRFRPVQPALRSLGDVDAVARALAGVVGSGRIDAEPARRGMDDTALAGAS